MVLLVQTHCDHLELMEPVCASFICYVIILSVLFSNFDFYVHIIEMMLNICV